MVGGGGLTCGLWVVFGGGFGDLFLGGRVCRCGERKKQIPRGNDRKKGKGKYMGLSTPHHKDKGRDAAVEMTECGAAGEADSSAALRNDSQKGKGEGEGKGNGNGNGECKGKGKGGARRGKGEEGRRRSFAWDEGFYRRVVVVDWGACCWNGLWKRIMRRWWSWRTLRIGGLGSRMDRPMRAGMWRRD